MKHMRSLWVGLLVMAFLVPMQAQAESEEARELKRYVEENTLKLVEKLESIQAGYEQDREAFYNQMDEALEDFVAFRRIAARVMGRYAREATPEQRNEFVRQFKRSLYDAYGGAIIDTGDFELRVRSAEINPRDENRATVNLQVITEGGNRYGVAYSMYRPEGGNWKLENIIVEGINIGLAFRDRFQQDMEEHRNDVQKVIDNWTANVGDLEGLDEAVESPSGEQ